MQQYQICPAKKTGILNSAGVNAAWSLSRQSPVRSETGALDPVRRLLLPSCSTAKGTVAPGLSANAIGSARVPGNRGLSMSVDLVEIGGAAGAVVSIANVPGSEAPAYLAARLSVSLLVSRQSRPLLEAWQAANQRKLRA